MKWFFWVLHPNRRETASSLLQWKGKHSALKGNCTEIPANKQQQQQKITGLGFGTAEVQFCKQTIKQFKTSLAPELSGKWKSYSLLLSRAWAELTLFKAQPPKEDEKGFCTSLGPGTRKWNTLIKHGRRCQSQPNTESLYKEERSKKQNHHQVGCWSIRKVQIYRHLGKTFSPTTTESGRMTAPGWKQEKVK